MKQTKPNKDIITIGDEYTIDDRPHEYICNYCNRTLVKISDRSGNNEAWFCNKCSIEIQPENEQIRHKQKLSVPDRNIEVCVSTTPGIDSLIEGIRIHKEPEIKGVFKTLQDRGIKIKDYKETDGAGRTILS